MQADGQIDRYTVAAVAVVSVVVVAAAAVGVVAAAVVVVMLLLLLLLLLLLPLLLLLLLLLLHSPDDYGGSPVYPQPPPTKGDKSSEDGVWLAAHAVFAGFIDLHFCRIYRSSFLEGGWCSAKSVTYFLTAEDSHQMTIQRITAFSYTSFSCLVSAHLQHRASEGGVSDIQSYTPRFTSN